MTFGLADSMKYLMQYISHWLLKVIEESTNFKWLRTHVYENPGWDKIFLSGKKLSEFLIFFGTLVFGSHISVGAPVVKDVYF